MSSREPGCYWVETEEDGSFWKLETKPFSEEEGKVRLFKMFPL